jgi:hypothetical protein
MDDFIIKDPTVVNARELYKNNYDIVFKAIAFQEYDDDFNTIPDGKYSLEYLGDSSPRFYLFNSDDKWTGIVLSLLIYKSRDDSSGPIKFNLPEDLQDVKYTLISNKGKYEITNPKKLTIRTDYQERLVSFFSKKLNKKVKFTEYPSYIPSQEEIAKSKGIVVSGDTNQPIKGATIEKTD